MLAFVETAKLKVTAENIPMRIFSIQILSAVLDEKIRELIEMRHLMNNPKYSKGWGTSYKKLGRLVQGMPVQVKETNTIMFINKEDIPTTRW